jgi:hypothetical protein
MAFDKGLAQRVREVLEVVPGFAEKKMFGGLGFMIFGNMACGIIGDAIIVRVGPERHQEALKRPHTKPFDYTGKAMRGWVVVSSDGIAEDEELEAWLHRGVDFARSLPPK